MNIEPRPEDNRPTPVAHPNRAVVRNSAVSVAALLPVLYPVLERSIGAGWAAFTIGAGIVGSAILTRLLSVPEVEAFLQQTIPVLASQPKPKEPTDD